MISKRFTTPVLALSAACMLSNALTAADSAWIERAPLPSARYAHEALLLPDGTVLVAGGFSAQLSSEAYDFRKNTWGKHATMHFEHFNEGSFALVALPQGHALAISPNSGDASQSEEYDPVLATWHTIPALPDERYGYQAAALPNGDVLVVGGILPNGSLTSLASCLLYHPGTATWTTTGSMSIGREQFTLNVLPDGRVLVAGGNSQTAGTAHVVASIEVYLPGLGVWQAAGALTHSREGAQSCVMANGQVLTTSGVANNVPTSERYLPETQTSLTTNRVTVPYTFAFTAVRGGALRAGGTAAIGGHVPLSAVDIFSSTTRSWTPGPELPIARRQAPAVTLPSGEVLVIGGATTFSPGNQHPIASVELYSLRPYFTQANAESSGVVGSTFSYQLDAATIATYTSVGLPPGIALNKVTGHLGGKPTTPGTYNVRIGATNDFGKSLMYLSLSIAPAPTVAVAPEAPQGGG